MKYVVTLNGKKYEVEVNESEAVITSVSNAAPAAPVAPVAAPAQAPSCLIVPSQGATISHRLRLQARLPAHRRQ